MRSLALSIVRFVYWKNNENEKVMHQDCLISLLHVIGVRRKSESVVVSSLILEIPTLLRKRGRYLANMEEIYGIYRCAC